MFTKIARSFQLITYYLLLTTFLTGCATAPPSYTYKLKETVRIEGVHYVPVESLCQIYNLDYYWDPITKKVILRKDDKEARMMVSSSIALLNNTVRTMDKEARFYQGSLVIPRSFVQKTLAPFFAEKYIYRKAAPATIRAPALLIKNVIIDPGHGGKDPGAIGRGGLKEKDVVLDIARRLKKKLSNAGINVILTRQSDRFVSLSRRSRIADTYAEDGTFFISIHANASRSKWVSGVEVFYLSESIDDNLRSLRAARNYDLNLKEGYSGKYTSAILWDLKFTDDRKSSNELAEYICYALSKNLGQKNRGTKPARFYVLKANIPAVLLEVGFISNAYEEKRLRSASYRDKIAEAIAEGIARYNRNFFHKRIAHY